VHVLGPAWAIVIDLNELEIREATGCNELEAYRTLRRVAGYRSAL
jgi:hypothetical protein